MTKEETLREWAKMKDKLMRATNLIIDSLYKNKLINEQQRKSYFTTRKILLS